MTLTSFSEFKKLFFKIPENRLRYVHFVELRTGTKVPIGTWKGKQHLTYYDVKRVMGYGGNIAVAGIPRGLMFLDIDTDNKTGDLLVSQEILDKIPNTFTVKTRSGGLHYYFLNNSLWDNQKFIIDGVEVGELRTNWQYVVSCGSWVEPETYRVINDVPINIFSGSITDYFKSSVVKDLTPKIIPPTEGKIGKPLSERTKNIIKEFYQKVKQ